MALLSAKKLTPSSAIAAFWPITTGTGLPWQQRATMPRSSFFPWHSRTASANIALLPSANASISPIEAYAPSSMQRLA